MKLTVYIFLLILPGSCAEHVTAVARNDQAANKADYAVMVQVLSGYSYSEVMDAARSAGTPLQIEIIDGNPYPFTIQVLRFRYEQVEQKDITTVQQRLIRCRGILSASITNE